MLNDAVGTANGNPICAMKVRIGPLSGVVVEALRFAFDALTPGTPAEGARLDIEETTLSIYCPHCGTNFTTPVGIYECPACGSNDGELQGGYELELISIEVPDHV